MVHPELDLFFWGFAWLSQIVFVTMSFLKTGNSNPSVLFWRLDETGQRLFGPNRTMVALSTNTLWQSAVDKSVLNSSVKNILLSIHKKCLSLLSQKQNRIRWHWFYLARKKKGRMSLFEMGLMNTTRAGISILMNEMQRFIVDVPNSVCSFTWGTHLAHLKNALGYP